MNFKTDYLVAIAFAFIATSPLISLFFDKIIFIQVLAVLILVLVTIGKLPVIYIKKHGYPFFYFGLLSFLYGLLTLSIFWSVYEVEYMGSLQELTVLFLLSFIALLVVNKKTVEYFTYIVIFISILTSLYLLTLYMQLGSVNIYKIVEDYLIVSRTIGFGLVLSFSFFISRENRYKKILFGIVILLFISLILSFGRGALLSSLFIIILITLVRYMKIKRLIKFEIAKGLLLFFSAFLVLITIGFILLSYNEYAFDRMSKIFSSSGSDLGGRELLWSNTIDAIKDRPIIGYGIGTSGVTSRGSADYYPHNLFLQIWSDGGVFSFLTLLLLVVIPIFRSLKKAKVKFEHLPILALFIFYVLEYSKSTNFYDARIFFVVGLMVLIKMK